MKKITKSLIAVFAIATTLVSCSKDESSTDQMQGKWTLDKTVLVTPDAEPQTLDLDGDCSEKNYFDLKKDGKSEEGRVNTETCDLSKLKGTWTKTNNSLEINSDGSDKTTFNVISVTTNKLVLRIAGSDEGTYADITFLK